MLRQSVVDHVASDKKQHTTSNNKEPEEDDDDWCNAVIKTFDTLPADKSLEGLVLILSEILSLKKNHSDSTKKIPNMMFYSNEYWNQGQI